MGNVSVEMTVFDKIAIDSDETTSVTSTINVLTVTS